ncbi:PTS glucose transporter subunit IIBC, partial [Vibrio parahaemolyticus]|nr:PTS glucose transporter subunit IIBC [Vibrio parahaemolyticus]
MIIGSCLAVVTYLIFYWAIIKFDIKTPGREESSNLKNTLIKEKRYGEVAEILINALGGKQNIRNVDN